MDIQVLDQIEPKLLNAGASGMKPKPLRPQHKLKRLLSKPKPKLRPNPTEIGKELVPIIQNHVEIIDICTNVPPKYELSDLEFIISDEDVEITGNDMPIAVNSIEHDEQIAALKAQHIEELEELHQKHKSSTEALEKQFKLKQEEYESMKTALATNKLELRNIKLENDKMLFKLNESQVTIETLSSENQRQQMEIAAQSLQVAEKQHELEIAVSNQNESSKLINSLQADICALNITISGNQKDMKGQLDIIDQQMIEINNQYQKIETQKTRIVELERKQQQLTTVASTSVTTTSTPSAITPNPTNKSKPSDKMAQMSKPVLFNGIRRYLNPSMIALLRMEMFGEAEREYKPDERDIAIELMKLPLNDAQPGSVYDFLRSEWRFRLPPRNSVLQWIQEREDNANNVEDEWDDC